ncbi:(2Fe-2S)-binding protein [bacterium]|nr:(2Fe-2S)-binding protein [bacterium]
MKRLKQVKRGEPFNIQVDNEFLTAYHGETLATVLLSAGKKIMRKSLKNKNPRGYYCGMGICNECLVKLEDETRVRACQTLAEPSMKIKTGA